jgi:Plasmid pRiA4b ORF-3-like protein
MAAAARIYQLKIALPYIKPAIWRRLEAPGNMTFHDLHDAIQIAMGWENCHLWMFGVGETEISPESEQFDFPGQPRARSAASTTLDDMLAGRCVKFQYEYDMGDSWTHEIKVEKVLSARSDVHYPRCTGGERACPPEDCGGFPGYFHLREAMADPKHPEHNEMLEWIGEEWNPEAFDLDAINAALKPRSRRPRKPKAVPG